MEYDITDELELKKILKQKTNYSFSKLKSIFNEKKDYNLMIFLIDFFSNNLENINFETSVDDNKYFVKLVNYYNYSLGKIELDNFKNEKNSLFLILDKLRKLNIDISDKIEDNEVVNATNNNIKNHILFLKINEKIEESIKTLENKIRRDYKLEVALSNNLEEICKELVLNIKNIDYVKTFFNNFKEAYYLKDYNDRLIFSDVLNNYFNVLLNQKDDELETYYEKLVNLYLINDTSDQYLNTIFLVASDKFLETVEKSDLETKKEKIKYIINRQRNLVNETDEDKYFIDISEDDIREDFTDRFVITIDSDEAKILENAISLEKIPDHKYRLSIYAVDMISFINSGDNYYKSAYRKACKNLDGKKAFKNYFKNKEVSLRAGVDMPVFAYQFIIDKDFNMQYFDFVKATIRVNENLTFSDFPYICVSESNELKSTVNNLLKLVFENLTIKDGINYKTASVINDVTNNFAIDTIKNYAKIKDLDFLYSTSNDYLSRDNDIESLSNSKVNLDFIIDELRYRKQKVRYISNVSNVEKNLYDFKLFSPVRNFDAMINQYLVSRYLVDKERVTSEERKDISNKLDTIIDALNLQNYYYVDNVITGGQNEKTRKKSCNRRRRD